MNRIVHKLFFNFCWGIAWRKLSSSEAPLPLNEVKAEYKHIPISCRHYYADPFLIYHADSYYLFAEHMLRSRGIGTIAVCQFDGKGFGKWRDVIVEDFHMSYPNVYSFENTIYMLPETVAAKKLILYRATSFPYQWEIDTVLLDNVELVDTSILPEENGKSVLLFSHDVSNGQKALRVYRLDLRNKTINEVDLSLINAADDRPGGNPIHISNEVFRPLQDCRRRYGERLLFYRVKNNGELLYDEEYVGTVEAKNTKLDHKVHIDCVHTLSRCNDLELIDYRYQRFYWNKPFLRVYQKMKSVLSM